METEQILPQLKAQLKQAKHYFNASKDKLNRERTKVEAYKTDMQNIKDMAEINEAIGATATANNDFSIDSARNRLQP